MTDYKITRLKEMNRLDKFCHLYIFKFLDQKNNPREWLKFEMKNFLFEEEPYDLECECRIANNMLEVRKYKVGHAMKEFNAKKILRYVPQIKRWSV